MILTLSTEFVIYKMNPLIWAQSSQELASLDRGSQTISGGSHTQSIVQGGGGGILCSDVITHVLTKSSEITLESESFTFNPLKDQTLMIKPLTEPFLTSDRDAHSTILI